MSEPNEITSSLGAEGADPKATMGVPPSVEPSVGARGDAEAATDGRREAGSPSAVDWKKPRVAAILRAAADAFARAGFDTTTAEIAKQIGIPKSVIYHYFDDKTTLVREAQRYAYAEHLEKVRRTMDTIRSRVGHVLTDVLRGLWQEPAMRDIAFDLGVWSELRNDVKLREQALLLRREHQRLLGGAIAEALGLEDRDPARTEPLSTLVLAALTGLSLNAYVEGTDEPANEAHEVLLELLELGVERFAKRPDSDVPPASQAAIDSDLPPAYQELIPGRVSSSGGVQ